MARDLKDSTEAAHGITRIGPKHQIHRGRGLPQLTEAKLQTVQRLPITIQHTAAESKMQEGTTYIERTYQVAGIVYENIYAHVF